MSVPNLLATRLEVNGDQAPFGDGLDLRVAHVASPTIGGTRRNNQQPPPASNDIVSQHATMALVVLYGARPLQQIFIVHRVVPRELDVVACEGADCVE
jgi:hypothetical protein